MIDFMAVALVLYPLYIVIQLIYGIFLLNRALRTRVHALISLFLISLFMAADVIVSDLDLSPPVLRNLVVMNYPILYLLFTKYAFYRGRKSQYKSLLTILCILRIIQFIEISMFNYTMPPTRPVDTPEKVLQYSFHIAIISVMHLIALVYLARASLLAHRDAENTHLEPWITRRNLLLAVGAILFAIQPAFWIFIPLDGSAYVGSWQGFAMGLANMFTGLAHVFINLFSWVMPGWFKAWLNRGHARADVAVPEGLPEKMPELVQKALSSRETMLVVDFIGNLLAPRIETSPGAAKGLLLLAVQKWQETSGKPAINFLEFRDVISTTLKSRLASVNVPEPDKVVNELLAEVTRNQYMIVMMII
jgi:hypothetical protein